MKSNPEFKRASWLYKYQDSIDLEPFFQRGYVWNRGKQQYFIDSLLKGWGVPKIFLRVTGKDSTGSETFDCLDGKQRLTSLFTFMSDGFTLNPKYTKEYSGKKFSELPRNVREKLDNYLFTVEMIKETTPDDAIELYKRLQAGSPLNFGEKIFAFSGNMNEFIKRRVLKKKFFSKKISLSDTRYAHYAVASQLCMLGVEGPRDDLKLNQLESFFREYSAFDSRSTESKKIIDVLNHLEKAFPGDRLLCLKNRANIVSSFYLVWDLTRKGKINGKEKQLGNFFDGFVKEVNKNSRKKAGKRDPELVSYQAAVTQGADKIKSIRIRHDILLARLALHNKFYKKLIIPNSPEMIFGDMYDQARVEKGCRNETEFELWLMTNLNIKQYKCKKARGAETIVGHVRNVIHHPTHGNFSSADFMKSLKILKGIVRKTKRGKA